MNWLTNFVRPKIRALVSRSADMPDNLWDKCPACGAMIFHRELDANLRVCTHCGNHLRLDAKRRLALLLDDGFQRVELARAPVDPLKFRDRKRYAERLKEAQAKSPDADALLVADGAIAGLPVVLAVFEFGFMGGSMGIAVGDGLIRAAERAVERRAALIVVPASGGARMQEGILSLMQMPRSTIAVSLVREAGLPYLVLLTDPTTGGVTASFAMLGDVTIAEPGAVVGFAGARVIEETIREKLPEGFQRAEYLLEHGIIDMVVPRKELKATLARVIGLLTHRLPDGAVAPAPLPALPSLPSPVGAPGGAAGAP
jgi:acetyl-CoA carboxylase carboxyl transferase subunit beta